jgi:biotin carboxyl carrier protein
MMEPVRLSSPLRAASVALACSALLAQHACAFVPRARWGFGLSAAHRPAPLAGSARPATVSMMAAPEVAEIFMPALSSTMTEGKIVEWTVKVGEKVKAGQTIMVVESDKVSEPILPLSADPHL